MHGFGLQTIDGGGIALRPRTKTQTAVNLTENLEKYMNMKSDALNNSSSTITVYK